MASDEQQEDKMNRDWRDAGANMRSARGRRRFWDRISLHIRNQRMLHTFWRTA